MLKVFDEAAWSRLRQALADAPAGPWTPLLAPASLRQVQRTQEGKDYAARIPAIAAVIAEACPLVVREGPHPFIATVLDQRIPPQPLLGTLLYGIRTFGETEGGEIEGMAPLAL